MLKAIERCLEEKLEIVHVAVLVDREEGGMDAIRARVPGVPVTAVFQRSQLDALRGRSTSGGKRRCPPQSPAPTAVRCTATSRSPSRPSSASSSSS